MICTYCRRQVGRIYPGTGAVCPRCGEVVVGTTSVKRIRQTAEACPYATATLAVWWGLLTNWRVNR
jgi:DNA-directed RNA polymerase subunit RPC12/RpoP